MTADDIDRFRKTPSPGAPSSCPFSTTTLPLSNVVTGLYVVPLPDAVVLQVEIVESQLSLDRGIDDRDIGVAAGCDRALLRVHAEDTRCV